MPFYYDRSIPPTGTPPTNRVAMFLNRNELTWPNPSSVLVITNNISGVTPDNVLQGIINLSGSPPAIGDLRNDINDNLIPILRNNFAELSSKVNDIRNVLANYGFFN